MEIYEHVKDNLDKLFNKLQSRSLEGRKDVEDVVAGILSNVKERGDAAVSEYTQKFDRVTMDASLFEVPKAQIDAALDTVDKRLLAVLEMAAANILAFHEKQRENSWFMTKEDGTILGQKVTPLELIGVYAPAGSAPLPSTVLMDVIPAKVAGVGEIILCSPPDQDQKVNSLVLAAAKLAGVDRVFSIGGAQAIAAMAYGTESVPKVDKIVGPGNIYVAAAKKMVFGTCGIDMVAGPSEVLVIADDTAIPAYVAADLLSQAEHDPLASSVLITTSRDVAQKVKEELKKQLPKLSRNAIALRSIEDYGAILLTKTLEEAVEISNFIAPEHLEVCVADPFALLSSIKNAGAIFLGSYSPEPLGDYFAGPNHTLPTSGTARFFSPLGVYDFIKRQSVISYSKKAFLKDAENVSVFADAEGLTAHAEAIRIRIRGEKS